MSQRISGVVKWYHSVKHFGFLLSDKDNREVFFHINDIKGFEPEENIPVDFELGSDKKGRPKAINIKKRVCVGVCDENNNN